MKFFFVLSITNFLFMITSVMLFCVFSLCFCLVVKFTLCFNIYSFRKFDPSRSNERFKVQKFGAPFEGAPILVFLNFCQIYLFFIVAYAENFMHLPSVVKKLEFWRPGFGKQPSFLVPQTLVKFYLFLIFVYLKYFMFPN